MANIKSQKKRIRTNEIARVRNKAIRSELKTVIKHVKAAVEAGDHAAFCRLPQARQGRGQGRYPQEPGRQPQVRRPEARELPLGFRDIRLPATGLA